jgi:hypothetical protein
VAHRRSDGLWRGVRPAESGLLVLLHQTPGRGGPCSPGTRDGRAVICGESATGEPERGRGIPGGDV